LPYLLLALIVIAVDQISKRLVVTRMELGESIPVIGEFFQIYSHRNRGAAFGILQNQRLFFIIVTAVILVGIVWYLFRMRRANNRGMSIALGLLLGGALGNFIDRVRTGEVVDFFKFRFHFGWFGREVDYTFAIFNVADTAIVVGVGLILLLTLLEGRRSKKEMTTYESEY
jgi:signal peptidase II